jgi:two-component system sensor histidine kinase DesK
MEKSESRAVLIPLITGRLRRRPVGAIELIEPRVLNREARAESPVFLMLPLAWIAWLLALFPPVTALLADHSASARFNVVATGVAIFVVVYVWAALKGASRFSLGTFPSIWLPGPPWLPTVILGALAVAINVIDGQRWLGLFIYTSATIGGHLPVRTSAWLVAGLTCLTVIVGSAAGATPSDLVWPVFLVPLTGGIVILMSWALRTNRELIATREELARVAVASERLRFARDLHDLLGHNLSLIALKSELAEYLITSSPENAAVAMREVGSVARTALQEVRQAVAGYRQPTLATELRDARELLDAAGIALDVVEEPTSPPPAIEAVLASAVRVGVTNVVRHSRARHCSIWVTQPPGYVGVEIADDGIGAASASATSAFPATIDGSGLRGLAERVAVLDGQCAFGPRPEGGFRLSVVLRLASLSPRPAPGALGDGDGPHPPTPSPLKVARGNLSPDTRNPIPETRS